MTKTGGSLPYPLYGELKNDKKIRQFIFPRKITAFGDDFLTKRNINIAMDSKTCYNLPMGYFFSGRWGWLILGLITWSTSELQAQSKADFHFALYCINDPYKARLTSDSPGFSENYIIAEFKRDDPRGRKDLQGKEKQRNAAIVKFNDDSLYISRLFDLFSQYHGDINTLSRANLSGFQNQVYSNFAEEFSRANNCTSSRGTVEFYDMKRDVVFAYDIKADILPGAGTINRRTTFIQHEFIPMLTNYIISILYMVSVGVVIIGGYLLMFSQGDEERYSKGRDGIVWGIIGVCIASAALVIVKIVLNINFFS